MAITSENIPSRELSNRAGSVAQVVTDESEQVITEVELGDRVVMSDRIDEPQIQDWIRRRFAFSKKSPHLQKGQVLSKSRPLTTAKDRRDAPNELGSSELFHLASIQSGYPLHHVRCCGDDRVLRLTGHVSRYYYAQKALEIGRVLADGRRVDMQIEVIPAPISECSRG